MTNIVDPSRFQLTSTGMLIPPDITQEEAVEACGSLERAQECVRWAIGDLLVQAELQGIDISQAYTEENESSYKVYYWVSKNVPHELRREGLHWTHHRAVAKMELEEISAVLAQAEENSWTVNRLIEETREGKVQRKRRDIEGAIAYSRKQVGKKWTKENADAIEEML